MSENGNKFLIGKDELLAARKPRTVEVDVPGYGTARVRALRGSEREELESMSTRGEKPDYRLYRARAVALALVDESDQAIFENPMKEANALSQSIEAIALDVLFNAVDSLSALTTKSQAALGKGLTKTENSDSSLN